MRRGHKSGGAQQRFNAPPDGLMVLKLIEQDYWIKQPGSESQEVAAA